jgi:hypothetical protein
MLHLSEWEYNTAASGGMSFGPVLISGGMFVLNDSQKRPFKFTYKGFGFGLASKRLPAPVRLPDIALPGSIFKGGTIAGTGATTGFDGDGLIFRKGNREPEPEEFAGITMYAEAGGGVLIAQGVTLFLTGIREEAFVPYLMAPALISRFVFKEASSVVMLYGASEGLVDGASASLMLGTISYEGPYRE